MKMCWYTCNACLHTHFGVEGKYRCSKPGCDCADRFGANPSVPDQSDVKVGTRG